MTGKAATLKALLARLRPDFKKDEALREARRQVAERERELLELRGKPGPSAGDVAPPAFFIIGRGRSGTTWLRGILNSHPEILCWGEGRFFERGFEREGYEEWQTANITPTSLYGALCRAEYLKAWVERSVWARGREADEHMANLTRLAVEYFMKEQLAKSGARIVGDKTPFVRAEVIEEISSVLPEAKVIHIIRDGRDVAVSLVHHMWNHAASEGGVYKLDPEELEKRDAYRSGSLVPPAGSLFAGERLSRIAADWSAEVGEVVEIGPVMLGENYAEVRYEDLLARPAAETGRLLEFLGADAGEEAVERCVERAGFERGAKRGRGLEDSTSRFRKGVKGDWKNVFTGEDGRVFKEEAGELLVRLGYEEDHDW